MTPQLRSHWQPVVAVTDPQARISVDGVGPLYADRERTPSRDIADQLLVELGTVRSRFLVCGARGSGKSTELVRLAALLRDDFTVLHIDVAPILEGGRGTLTIVLAVALEAVRRVAEWEGYTLERIADHDIGGQLARGLRRWQDDVNLSELIRAVGALVAAAPGEAPLLVGGAMQIVGSLSNSGVLFTRALRPLNDLVKGAIGDRVTLSRSDDARALVDTANNALARLHGLTGKLPLLLIDGLDRLKDPTEVEQALYDDERLRDLEFPLVLTGPVTLRADPRFNTKAQATFHTALLYNVPVVHPDGTPDPRGVANMAEVWRRRAEHAAIDPGVLPADGVAYAARMSSGIYREFLGILKRAALNALRANRRVATRADVDLAVADVRNALQNQLNDARIHILSRVATRRTLPDAADTDRLLFENFIACYRSTDIWFRPHETLVSYVMEHAVQGNGGA